MKPASSDLENRLPLWKAMSDLFLDTEIDDVIYHSIAQICRESLYSWNECDYIFWEEVYPACIWNLLIVAGEWIYFDEEQLQEKILQREAIFSRVPWRYFRCRVHLMRSMVADDWEKVKMYYENVQQT